ncbi:MAG: aminotransferase class I/II-fold pyridoxal phosphate-dependent enzyme, partial [Nitrospirota bacterium]
KFRHNDMADLERILKEYEAKDKLIVVDGVFSMEGDIANLPEVVALAKKYGARVMVDDAHGIGVLGKTGRGTAEHFGLEDEVDLIMGTYSKSLASIGGFIAGSADVIHYIKHFARSLIFSASPPPASVASVSAALDIIENEPERRELLWKNTKKMFNGLKKLGFEIGPSQTPIIPIVVGEDQNAFTMTMMLQEEGVFANVAVSPAVPNGRALIRTSYMATHTDEHLDKVLNAFEKVGKQLGII